LLEKETAAHHKVCGEFLSREAVGYLEQAGVSLCELGATEIDSLQLSSGRWMVCANLPFRAFSLSRYVLDEAMMKHAQEGGCEVRRGVCVDSVEAHNSRWQIRLRDGETLFAQSVFLANGKHDVRGWSRKGGKQCDLVGFKMHWRLNPIETKALRGVMDLFLFRGGYGGLSLIERETGNLCFVVRRTELQRIGTWDKLLAAILSENVHLCRRMRNADALWERPLAVSSIPYGYLVNEPSGIWRIGDQAAVVPSFTGDGMAIALHSGALAAEMFLAGASADGYHRRLAAQLSRGISLATHISRAMVTGAGPAFAPFGLRLFPHAVQWIANSTRIPESAILFKEKPQPSKPILPLGSKAIPQRLKQHSFSSELRHE
jgi:flavin-dependent dehydrogenase